MNKSVLIALGALTFATGAYATPAYAAVALSREACLTAIPTILTDNEADEGTITEMEMEIAISTGTFTASNGKKTYHSVWRSTAEPYVLLSCGVNNMADASGKLHLYIANGNSCTYTISAPRGYEVAGFDFDFVKPSDKASVTVTAGSTVLASTESTQHISGNGLSSFTLSGSGTNPIEVSNFKVRLKKVALENDITDVFTTQADDVPYRIPAITRTKNNHLLAVADYRYCGSDIGYGKIDLRYRISSDNGKTWGDIKTLVNSDDYPTPTTTTDETTNETTTTLSKKSTALMHTGFGDPCIVTDSETGKVMVLSCTGNVTFQSATRDNHQGIARFYSTDNGETWKDPTEISESIYTLFDKSTSGKAESLFIGSGRIFQSHTVKVGTSYRLYCVVLLKGGRNYVLYSDDFGTNWAVLGGADTAPITGGDEPKAEELPDGSVLVSSRINGGRKYNIFRFTNTAKTEGTWGTQGVSNADNNGVSALSNSTNGEILILPAHRKADNQDVYLALQSVPFGPGRTNVGIYYKELSSYNDYATPADFAADWDGSYQVSRMGSAYSTMVLQSDNHIGFLYEESTYGKDYTIVYQNLPLETITSGKYEYASSIAAGTAQPDAIGINSADGSGEKNGSSDYFCRFISNKLEGLTLSCGTVNNMCFAPDGTNLTAYSKDATGLTYDITVPYGYSICGYEFDFQMKDNNAVQITAGGKTYTATAETQHLIVNGLKGHIASFKLACNAATKPVSISNFKVMVTPITEEAFDVFKTDKVKATTPYRIPAITTAQNGDVIAVSDYRFGGGDIGNGNLDLRYRILSKETGEWSEVKTLADHTKYTDTSTLMHTGFGDPCIVTDSETGKMLLLCCTGNVTYQNGTRSKHQGIARFYSEDNGQTWQTPTEISESIYTQFDDCKAVTTPASLFIGSGRIFQSRTVKVGSSHRLYCAILMRDVKVLTATARNFVLYSDDFGQNWKVLGGADVCPITGGDEPKTEELPDGSILLSSRTSSGRIYNIFTFEDGSHENGSWGSQAKSQSSNNGIASSDSGTNGEVMVLPVKRNADGKKVFLLLQSLPMGSGRNNVGIYYKELSSFNHMKSPEALASSWTGSYQVSHLASAYSTMSLLDTHHIGFLYEESTYGKDYTIRYQDLPLETITGGQYSYTDKASTDRFVNVTSTVADVSSLSADAVYCISNYNSITKKFLGSNTQSVNAAGQLASSSNAFRTSTDGDNLDVLWKVIPQSDGTFLIQHIQTGAYLGQLTANAAATKLEPSESNAGAYDIAAENASYDKAFTLRNNGHLANAYQGDANTCMADYSGNHTGDKGSFWTFTKYDAVFTDISSLGYASYAMPFETTIATKGVKAYYATATDDDMLLLTEVPGGVIPAGEGVVLTGPAEATVRMNVSATKAVLPQPNLLKGTAARRTGFAAESMYLLAKSSEGDAAFLLSRLTAVPANKAYLPTASLPQTNGISSFAFQFTETPTGMGAIEAEAPNGNKPEEYYDLNGRRVLYPVHGIFVTRSGRKVLIK